jgi:hypothetical protein
VAAPDKIRPQFRRRAAFCIGNSVNKPKAFDRHGFAGKEKTAVRRPAQILRGGGGGAQGLRSLF